MFHVPNAYRVTAVSGRLASGPEDGNNGLFRLPAAGLSRDLYAVASDGQGWEHVSVQACDFRRRSATPTWEEMCRVKDAFWDGEDVVMQLHPRRSEYVNCHPNVLHLWRPIGREIPIPPTTLVGPRSGPPAGEETQRVNVLDH